MPKRILLADDSVTIQKVITLTFASEDFDLTVVDNGEEAIERARYLKPDLVMSDVAMPGKDGYRVCEAIKNDPETAWIPVLLLAGTFEPLNEEEASRVKADDHIVKPFESQELINKVKGLVASHPRPGGVEASEVEVPGISANEETFAGKEFLGVPGTPEEETFEMAPGLDIFEGRGFLGEPEDREPEAPQFEDLELREEGFGGGGGGEGGGVSEPAKEVESEEAPAAAPPKAEEAAESEGLSFSVEDFDLNPFKGESFEAEVPDWSEPVKAEKGWGVEESLEAPGIEEKVEAPEEAAEPLTAPTVEVGEASVERATREAAESAGDEVVKEVGEEYGGLEAVSSEEVSGMVERVAAEIVRDMAGEMVPELARRLVDEELQRVRETVTGTELNATVERLAGEAVRSAAGPVVEESARRIVAEEVEKARQAVSAVDINATVERLAREALGAEDIRGAVEKAAAEAIKDVVSVVVPELAQRLITEELNRIKEAFARRSSD